MLKHAKTLLSSKDIKRLEKQYKPDDALWYQLLGYLHEGVSVDQLLEANGQWNSLAYYDTYRTQRQKEDLTWIMDDTAVEEGSYTCANKACKSKRCYVWTEQNRSGDEGFTVHVTCSICGHHYEPR